MSQFSLRSLTMEQTISGPLVIADQVLGTSLSMTNIQCDNLVASHFTLSLESATLLSLSTLNFTATNAHIQTLSTNDIHSDRIMLRSEAVQTLNTWKVQATNVNTRDLTLVNCNLRMHRGGINFVYSGSLQVNWKYGCCTGVTRNGIGAYNVSLTGVPSEINYSTTIHANAYGTGTLPANQTYLTGSAVICSVPTRAQTYALLFFSGADGNATEPKRYCEFNVFF